MTCLGIATKAFLLGFAHSIVSLPDAEADRFTRQARESKS